MGGGYVLLIDSCMLWFLWMMSEEIGEKWVPKVGTGNLALEWQEASLLGLLYAGLVVGMSLVFNSLCMQYPQGSSEAFLTTPC